MDGARIEREKSMNEQNLVAQVLLSSGNVKVLYWGEENGWKTVSDGCASLPREYLEPRGLQGLLSIVTDADRKYYCQFLDAIMSGECENTITGFVNLSGIQADDNSQKEVKLYKIECFIEQEEKRVKQIVATIQLASAEECYREELARRITSDRNPQSFLDSAKSMLLQNPDEKFAVIQFDVKNFKVINQQYGEIIGDEILNYFVKSMDLYCKGNQLFTRLTADVFMLMTSFEDESDLEKIVKEIDGMLKGYKDIPYSLYFGICVIEDWSKGIRLYGDCAAFARQSVKMNALKHVAYYEEDMANTIRMYKFLEDHMVQALQNGEFHLYLQPKFSISTGALVGAEGLVRWKSEKYGVIMPNDFIPLFERNGFVVNVDYYMWEEACKILREWEKRGEKLVPISVNMSRRHFNDHGFLDKLEELVDTYHVDKRYLELEITETIDNLQAAEAADLLKHNGYTLLMDDFGSGYSSLNTLKDTKFDVVKIDRIFLKDFIDSDRGKKIVEHTIKMTKDIGLDMIAEGVETREQAVFLSQCGCDKAQGFYYAKPMPVQEFDRIYMNGQ